MLRLFEEEGKEENIEKLFKEDIREKKITGSGARHMASRTGRIRTMRFPSDFLTNSQKKKLNGKVKIYMVWENILSYTEFNELDNETKKQAMEYWREHYGLSHLGKVWGKSTGTIYGIIHKLGLPTKTGNRRKRDKSSISSSVLIPSAKEIDKGDDSMQYLGLQITLGGIYSNSQIKERLNNLLKMFDGEEGQYELKVFIKEVEEEKHEIN